MATLYPVRLRNLKNFWFEIYWESFRSRSWKVLLTMACAGENEIRISVIDCEKPIVKFTRCDFIVISLSLLLYVADIVTGWFDSYAIVNCYICLHCYLLFPRKSIFCLLYLAYYIVLVFHFILDISTLFWISPLYSGY